MEKILIEKQVWESTLNRSMVLEAENEQLKELLEECVDWLTYIDRDNGIIAKIDQVLGENK